MKVFEVITRCEHDGKVLDIKEYVTTDGGFKEVVLHYVDHCEQYEMELVGVTEVLTIVQHIKIRK
jgi:hypothetical protein